MVHYHKSRNQKPEKTKRFIQSYGMNPSEFRELRKSDPQSAHQIRLKAVKIKMDLIKTVKQKE